MSDTDRKELEREFINAENDLRRSRGLPPRELPDRGEPPYCSFCGYGKKQVKVLIEGPTANICNECIEYCRELVAKGERHG